MYDRQKAIEYAKKYAFHYNPNYFDFRNFGGDCTNFISQCLYAGNIKMDYDMNGWFYTSSYSRSPSWTSVEAFFNYGQNGKTFKLQEVDLYEVEVGDVVQFYSEPLKRFYHSVIVTEIIKPISIQNILVSSHDNSAYNKSLIEYHVTSVRYLKVIA